MLQPSFWRRYFEIYDVLNNLIPYKELLLNICEQLEIKRGDKILDAGSGTGNLSLILEKHGASVTGIDFSLEGIAIHQKKQQNISIVYGDLTHNLPFPNNSFDKIASNNTIYTLGQKERVDVFREFYRILKPGGTIVISNIKEEFKPSAIYFEHLRKSTNNKGVVLSLIDMMRLCIPTIRIFYYNYIIRKEEQGGTYNFVTSDEQRLLLKGAGFRNICDNIDVYSNQAILNKAFK